MIGHIAPRLKDNIWIKEARVYWLQSTEAHYIIMEWQERYGHLAFKAYSYIPKAPQTSLLRCEHYIKVKMTKPVSQYHDIRTTKMGEILPMWTTTYARYSTQRYMLNRRDDFSCLTMTRLYKPIARQQRFSWKRYILRMTDRKAITKYLNQGRRVKFKRIPIVTHQPWHPSRGDSPTSYGNQCSCRRFKQN